MKETSARLLRLLTLLQTRREWSGAELADRLRVSTRTVRRDVEKLRDLDYPVHAATGTAGGYRLRPGTELPPLLLDDDEAVAVAVALRTAAGGGVDRLGETALGALVKLEQVLPSRLRHRVDAMQVSTVDVPSTAPKVDPDVLTAVASACRDRHQLRFDYQGGYGAAESRRTTEPHRLVTWGRRWYLVAWDRDRDDWRTFRMDRLRPLVPVGPRFTPREIPGGDPAAFVASKIADRWPFRASVRLHAPADHVDLRGLSTYGTVEPIDEHTCRLTMGSDTPHSLAFLLTFLEIEFDVESSPALSAALLQVAGRFQRAAGQLVKPVVKADAERDPNLS
jgi:predicted DNA-binding transcriptional regulator YafY